MEVADGQVDHGDGGGRFEYHRAIEPDFLVAGDAFGRLVALLQFEVHAADGRAFDVGDVAPRVDEEVHLLAFAGEGRINQSRFGERHFQ